jgi:hypothetical protein
MDLLMVEVNWLHWLLDDFSVFVTTSSPLLSNSTCAICIVRDLVKHVLTKHIDIDDSFVRTIVYYLVLTIMCRPGYSQGLLLCAVRVIVRTDLSKCNI